MITRYGFNRIIEQIYSNSDQKLLDAEAERIKGYTYALEWDIKWLIPFLSLNPDITLRIYTRKTTLTSNSNLEQIKDWLEYDNTSENEHVLNIVECPKGWTFAEKALKGDPEYTFLDRVSLYASINVSYRIRIFKKGRNIIFITNKITDDLKIQIFSAIPLMFQKEFTYNKEVLELFKSSITLNDSDWFILFKNYLNKIGLLTKIKENHLNNAITNFISNQRVKLLEAINVAKDRLEEYEKKVISANTELMGKQAQLAYFKPQIDTKELIDYIRKNPYIVDFFCTGSNDSYLVLAIEAPLEFIDGNALKAMLKNTNSYLYPTNYAISNPIIVRHPNLFAKFLYDVFLGERYRFYTRSEVVLNIDPDNTTVNSLKSSSLDRPAEWYVEKRASEDRLIVPHTHIEYYNCWSGNRANAVVALQRQDIIRAIDICVNTTKDINVNDSAVFKRFLNTTIESPHEYFTNRNRNTYEDIPTNMYKTIYDYELKKFRTFYDIFKNDYIGNDTSIEITGDDNEENNNI